MKWNQSKPEFYLLGSGSDHAAFAFVAGVPAINVHFKLDNKKYPQVGSYPPYHTGYDTFYLVDKILDPGESKTGESDIIVLENLKCNRMRKVKNSVDNNIIAA